MSNRTRYTLDEIQRNTFYQMPKFLFEGEFNGLDNNAIVAYSLLRDRHDLSTKNQWINENGEIYLLFTREELCKLLRLSEPTVIKTMKTLKKFNLVEEERQGLGKPNKIYLLTVKNIDISQNLKSLSSGTKEILGQELKDFVPNDTELKIDTEVKSKSMSTSDHAEKLSTTEKTDMTKTIDADTTAGVIISDLHKTEEKLPEHGKLSDERPLATGKKIKASALTPTTTNYQQAEATKHPENQYSIYQQIILQNIGGYEYFNRSDHEMVESLIQTMLDVILTENPDTVKIGKETKSRNIVKSVYLKLKNDHIQHVIDQYKAQHHQITYKTAYLRTMLYSVFQEIEPHYTNQVRADGMVR